MMIDEGNLMCIISLLVFMVAVVKCDLLLLGWWWW